MLASLIDGKTEEEKFRMLPITFLLPIKNHWSFPQTTIYQFEVKKKKLFLFQHFHKTLFSPRHLRPKFLSKQFFHTRGRTKSLVVRRAASFRARRRQNHEDSDSSFPPGSGVSGCDDDEAEEAASSLTAPWDRDRPRPGGSFMPSCSAISTWSPGWM